MTESPERNRMLWWALPIWFVAAAPSWIFISIGFDSSLIWIAVELALLASGILILSNVRLHKVGLLLFIAGAAFSLGAPLLATMELLEGAIPENVTAMGVAVAGALITIWVPLSIAAIALFPTGAWPTPKWRYPGILIWFSIGLAVLAPMLNGGFGGDNSDGDATPWAAATAPLGDIVSNLFFLSILLSAAVTLTSVIYRFIRSEGVERQQMKWFALSVSILTVGMFLDQVVLGLTSADGWRAVWIGLLIIQALVAMAIAIIKYRIYEIDRLISRTVSYVLIVGSLGLIFFAVVTSVTTLLPSQNSLAVAASTLAVAGLFNPLRTRIQKWVDHRFNRARYDAQKVVDNYTSGLRNQTDLNQLTKDLTDLIDDVLQPSSTSIWVRD